jgi:hypothetical protein
MDAPAIWAGVRTRAGRHRLWHGLTRDTPATHPLVVGGSAWFEYDDLIEVADRPGYYSITYRRTADAPDVAAFPGDVEEYIVGTAKHLHTRLEWQRAERVIVLLESFGTPEATDVLKGIVGGHPASFPRRRRRRHSAGWPRSDPLRAVLATASIPCGSCALMPAWLCPNAART